MKMCILNILSYLIKVSLLPHMLQLIILNEYKQIHLKPFIVGNPISFSFFPLSTEERFMLITPMKVSVHFCTTRDFPGGSDGKASAYNAGDPGSIPGSRRSPGEGNGNPFQYSCLENPMDGGAWWAIIHGSQRVKHD